MLIVLLLRIKWELLTGDDIGLVFIRIILYGLTHIKGVLFQKSFYGLVYTDNTSGYGETVIWEESTSGYPSDWSSTNS